LDTRYQEKGDSTGEPSTRMGQHDFTELFLLSFYKLKLIYAALLFTSEEFFGSNLNMYASM
jgi:hypothetical protein